MSTVIRAEVSKKNEFYIEKHRFYELKHYCMQYQSWKKSLESINLYPRQLVGRVTFPTRGSDPVVDLVEARMYFTRRIEMLDRVAREADPVIGPCVLAGITTDTSYDALRTRIDIPCGKDLYYTIYRKFFWLLDKERK